MFYQKSMVCKLNTLLCIIDSFSWFQCPSWFIIWIKKDQIRNIECISESQCTLFKKWEKLNTSIFGTLVLREFCWILGKLKEVKKWLLVFIHYKLFVLFYHLFFLLDNGSFQDSCTNNSFGGFFLSVIYQTLQLHYYVYIGFNVHEQLFFF